MRSGAVTPTRSNEAAYTPRMASIHARRARVLPKSHSLSHPGRARVLSCGRIGSPSPLRRVK